MLQKTINRITSLLIFFCVAMSVYAQAAYVVTENNTKCNGVSAPTSLFQVKFAKGYVFDVFRDPAFPKAGREQKITAHCNPYRTSGDTIKDSEWPDGYYMGLVDRGKVSELDNTNAEQYRVYNNVINSSAIAQAGVVVEDICLVATALFNEQGELVEYLGQYGVLWGLSKQGFLFVDYTMGRELGTFYFMDKIERGDVLRYTPDYTLVTSIDVIINFFDPEEMAYSTCNGKAKVILPDDSTHYTFKWNDDMQQTTCTALNLCAGSYEVQVTDKRTGSNFKLSTSLESQPPVTDLGEIEILPGETYLVGNTELSTEGFHKIVIPSTETKCGCDSTVLLNLKFHRDDPITPEDPETPEVPDEPQIPEEPIIPDTPAVPEEPEVPVLSKEELQPALFFTPNGDGNNDFWVIKNIHEHCEVYIFNRHDLCLAKYKGNFTSWDGIYNGRLLPTDDYWYLIIDNKRIKRYTGHFTLRR
jgi:gliding motility-associated-like protein